MIKTTKKLALDKAQKDILKLIEKWKASEMTLEEIGDYAWLSSSSAVFYKLKQLETKWYIRKDENGNYISMEIPLDAIYYFPFIWFAYCGNIKDENLSFAQTSESIPFPTKEIALSNPQDITKYFFTRAVWVSMLPLIKPDDLLLIRAQDESNPNDITLLIHNWTPKIKNIIPKWDTSALVSLNKTVPDYEITEKNDEIRVIWIVKKVISST